MALNEERSTITAEQYDRLDQLIANGDRKGFYVALYEMTGSQAALDMAEISSSSGIRGGAAWAINEWMAKNVPGYPDGGDPVGDFSVAIASATFNAITSPNSEIYTVPSDLQIYLQAHDTWDQVGEGFGNPNLGDYFPGNIVLAAHYFDVGDKEEATKWWIQTEGERVALAANTAYEVLSEIFADSRNNTISFDEALEQFGSFELVTGPDGESIRVFNDEDGRVAYIIRSGEIDRSNTLADESSVEGIAVAGINLVTGALDYFTDELGRVLGTYQLQNTLLSVEEGQLPAGRLELEYIAEKSASELEALFQSDPAVRFALTKGNVYVIREDLAVYDSSELAPENFSDEYIRDRIRFMEALRFDSNEEDIAFRNLESGLNAGANPSSSLFGERVIFGSERGEVIEGSEFGDDKLYGGDGRDVLSGLGEDDYLEGNEGRDTLNGGAGEDILIGGEENDQLSGGTGFDEYRFRPGDGADTVYDIDGLGRILIGEEAVLDGTSQVGVRDGNNTVWESADGEYVYTLVDGSLDGGTLEITSPGLEPDDKITIRDFRNGDLGIELNPQRGILLTAGPFSADGSGASSTTLAEGGARAFQIELNRPAEAGDRILLTLGGAGANTVLARLGGDVLRFADGEVILTLEEGQLMADFSLTTEGDIDANSDLNLEAIYVSADGESDADPASITVVLEADEAPDGQTSGGQQVIGDYAWADVDADEPGDQYGYDALGNRIYDTPLKEEPGQNDVLQARLDGDGNITMEGRGGDDILISARFGTGDDHVMGGEGNDALGGGLGDDLLEGGAGNDIITGSDDDDRLYGDTEESLSEAIINGNIANGTGQRGDALGGDNGDDLLVGGAGNDLLSGGNGNDTLVAGAGDDFLFGDQDWSPIARFDPDGVGEDDIGDYAEWDTSGLDWQASLDVTEQDGITTYNARITNSESTLATAPGDDLIYAGAGNDYVSAGNGDDVVYAERGDDVVFGSRGDDTLIGGEGNDVLNGDNGLIASSEHGQDFIDGGDGDDTLIGGGGADVIFGGADDDQIFGGSGDSNDGDDFLHGEAGNDVVVGGTGDDLIFGGTGDDQLGGESGGTDPELQGDDRIYGGAGNDEITGAGGEDRLRGGAGDDILDGDVSNLASEYHGDDVLDGDAGDDTLFGSGGGDTLRGGDGRDTLIGDGGNIAAEFQGDDLLEGDAGDDTLIGGGGSDQLFGGADNDSLDGDGGDVPPEIHGDDFLEGADGDDILIGNGGSDVLVGGEGSDQVFGDAGDLEAEYHGDDILDGGNGDDVLVGGGGQDAVFGGAGADALLGDASGLGAAAHDSDYLDGGDGDDTLIGHGGDDTLLGGIGNDGLSGDAQSVAGEFHGDDYLDGSIGADNLVGAGGDDTLFGGDGNDLLYGDASWVAGAYHGNDYLDGGAGNDQLLGFGGDDSLLGGGGNDLIGGRDGNDYLSGGAGEDQLVGDAGDDYLSGGEGNDSLFGGAGSDTLIGGAGFDFLSGGAGNDLLLGGGGFDAYSFGYGDGNVSIIDAGSNVLQFGGGIRYSGIRLGIGSLKISLEGTDDAVHIESFDPLNPYQSTGIDRFEFADGTVLSYEEFIDLGFDFDGTAGDDVLRGTNATDRLRGLAGDDRILGLAGDDVLDGGAGHDVLEGGLGDDEYRVDNLSDEVVEGVDEGRDRVVAELDYVLGDNVEDLIITAGATRGTGNADGNVLVGNDADNQLAGLEGNDVLEGGGGNDLLDGGTGADALIGGAGDDTYLVDNIADTILEDANGGRDKVISSVSYVLPDSRVVLQNNGVFNPFDFNNFGNAEEVPVEIEDLQLVGGQAENGTGNRADNRIQGNDLDNRLDGRGGSDELLGAAGNDVLIGGSGDDRLFGGDGTDTLQGGSGADQLAGGAGDDTYVVDGIDTVVEVDGDGTDTAQSAASYTLGDNLENLVLTGGSVNGTGNVLDNHIVGSNGANRLDGAGGGDILEGGRGNDTYVIDSAQDTVVEELFGGTDTVEASVDHTLAENVERLILADGLAEEGRGNAGNNFVQGNTADNRLYGAAGNDTLYGGTGGDLMEGGTGSDYLFGEAGADTLHGDAGNDRLYGQAGKDVLRGGDGSDYLNGGQGADRMAGGRDSDTYAVDDAGDEIVEAAGEGYDVVESSVTHTLSDNVEDLYLTGNDAIDGSGNALDNRLFGNWASNGLNGGAGDDYLDGGRGGDVMAGGRGSDTYIVNSGADQVVEQAGEGTDTVESSVSRTLSDNLENLVLTGEFGISGTGNSLDNDLLGNDYTNSLQGEAGDDSIDGAGGNDSMSGGDGDDYLYGGDDAIINSSDPYGGDYSYGGYYGEYDGGYYGYGGSTRQVTPNDDLLSGGNGDDHLDGGSGDDALYGDDGDDYLYGGDDGLAALDDGYGGSSYYGGASYYGGSFYYGGSSYGGHILANSNNDRLYGGDGRDVLDGGNGSDRLYGGADADALIGGTGNDLLDGGTGIDTMAGGQGSDIYYVDGYSETIEPPDDGGNDGDGSDGGSGNHDDTDCPSALGKGNEGLGNGEDPPPPGHDTNWNDGPGTSPGNPGSQGGANAGLPKRSTDTDGIAAGGGESTCGTATDGCSTFGDFGTTIQDGSGTDDSAQSEVRWYTDDVTEQAGSGYDVVYSSATFTLPEHVEELRLTGSEAIDATGSAGNNSIYGNAAANRLDGGGGSNRLTGGAGDDTYVVDTLADTLVETAGGGIDTVESTVDYTLGIHLENLTLTGDEHLTGTGTEAANHLQGNAGDNVLDGGGGNDVLKGGAGTDLLRGGLGDDSYLYQLGDGLNRIEDIAGSNVLRFDGELTAANVVARSSTVDGTTTVHLRLVDSHGNEMPDQGVDFALDADDNAPVSTVEFADGTSATLEELRAVKRDYAGSRRRDTFATGQEDDTFHLGRGHDQVLSGGGRDTLYGEDGKDSLYGQAGDDRLYGDSGRDTLGGGTGFDLLAGGVDNDVLDGGCQNDLLLGGQGDDLLAGGHGNDLLAGGAGADVIMVGGGNGVVLYNAGDGGDRIVAADASNYTLSLGGEFRLADLTLARADGDLVLEVGEASGHPGRGRNAEQGSAVTFAGWDEQTVGDAPQVTLQLIMEASADFDAGAADPLRSGRVQHFDFNQLAEAFEASGQDRWSVTDALLASHLENDSDAALGGNLAKSFGTTGNIGDLSASEMIGVLTNPKLGEKPQPLTIT